MEGNDASLGEAARQLGIPLVSAHVVIHRHDATAARYRALQASMAELWEAESAHAIEEGARLVLDPGVDAKRANAVANVARSLSERYAWRAKVADPSRYGDQLNVKGAVDVRAVVLLPPLAGPASAIAAAMPAELAGPDAGHAGALLAPAPASAASPAGDAGPLALDRDASAPGDAGRPGTRPAPVIRATLAPPAPASDASAG